VSTRWQVPQHFDALLETLGQGGNETPGARLRRHFESIAPSTQKAGVSPLQLISTLSADGPALPYALVLQIAEGVRLWNTKVAARFAFHQLLARRRDSHQIRPIRAVRLSTIRA
jgi:hypothetical protein